METNNNHLPGWLIEHLQAARLLFGVGDEWHIFPVLVKQTNEKEFEALTDYDTAYLNAVIKFDEGIKDDYQGQQAVLHEVLHIALCELAQTFEYTLKLVPSEFCDVLTAIWRDAEERTIQRITRAMQRQIRPFATPAQNNHAAAAIATNGDASA